MIGSRSATATAPTPRRQPAELPSTPVVEEVEAKADAAPVVSVEEPEPEPSDIELPAWLRIPPGEMAEINEEEPEAEAQQETPEAELEPPVEPLAWLHSAEEAQAMAEPPAPGELLAAPPADLDSRQAEVEGELVTSISLEPAAEEPILGETRPSLAEPETSSPSEPPDVPFDEPITGETRKIATGRSHTQQICSHCGNSSPLSARFCGVCGNQLRD